MRITANLITSNYVVLELKKYLRLYFAKLILSFIDIYEISIIIALKNALNLHSKLSNVQFFPGKAVAVLRENGFGYQKGIFLIRINTLWTLADV